MSDLVWLTRKGLQNVRGDADRIVHDGDVVDLATAQGPRTIAQIEAKRLGGRGSPPAGEYGSAWDRWRMYAYFEDGVLYEEGPIETANIEEMLRRDGTTRQLEQAITLPLRGATWSIKPAKGDQGECEFVQEALTTPPAEGGMQTPFDLVLGQMTSARLYKRACFEKVFAIGPDGRYRYQKLDYRQPTTTYVARVAEDASFAGFMQWTWKGMDFVRVLIPASKAFVYIHGAYRDPLQGVSDMEVAYTAYQSKQKLRFLWAQFLETQANPRTWAKEEGTDQTRVQELAKKIASLKGGGVVGLTGQQTVGVIEANGTGASEYSAAIAYLDQEMNESCLAGFLTLTRQATGSSGSGSSRGSNALSKDNRAFFDQANAAVLREMAGQVRHQVVADLVRYNFGTGGAVPTFEFDALTETDAGTDAVALLQAIASAPTPTPLLPYEFIDLLIERVAGYLGIDVDKVAQALTAANHDGSKTPAEVAVEQQVAAGSMTPQQGVVHVAVDRATRMVQTAKEAPGADPVAAATGQ